MHQVGDKKVIILWCTVNQSSSDFKIALFAYDYSIIITSPNQEGLQIALNKILSDINSWFKGNFLSLNFNKTYYLQFWTKKSIDNTLGITYLNKTIANLPYTKFLGLVVDDTLTWNNHIDQLISRLNSACYAIRAVNAMLSRKAFRMLYFSYVHSEFCLSSWPSKTGLVLCSKSVHLPTNSSESAKCKFGKPVYIPDLQSALGTWITKTRKKASLSIQAKKKLVINP